MLLFAGRENLGEELRAEVVMDVAVMPDRSAAVAHNVIAFPRR